ncbi:MAG: type II toxin-antitoxin system VapC family toxin [Dolichospermum sp. DET50]|nr:type II toxin-antitoxin system VapC family toxin [Dolichospermum sp. DET66]MBS3034049.1 type II toxin-antitoxin system VapC family toxin [Dolichospermum sp. DET67]MBS3039252.1 type II toxin-antitoxin system VapC family toxin [Dolichospermum sp. DET50]QSX66482.1 MAG: type II toxin-antitoxin system VapC family toxin [Dolichospermum sp. DET69]
MKLLLDTHIFLWLIDNDGRLSDYFCQELKNPNNERFLSVASIWECVIKYQQGKLSFPNSPEIYLPEQRRKHLIKSLVVDENSIAQLINLPSLHRDPFDRLLISQALQHDLIMVTEDRAILAYPMIKFLDSN